MSQALIKTIEVDVKTTADVQVSIENFTDDDLLNELVRREKLHDDEAEALRNGDTLRDFYSENTDLLADPDAYFQPELGNAVAELRGGRVIEALIYVGRMHRDLADIGYRAERGDLVMRGA